MGIPNHESTYAIEIDTHKDAGTDQGSNAPGAEGDSNHVAILRGHSNNHIRAKNYNAKSFTNESWHTMKVRVQNRKVTVWVNNKKVFAYKANEMRSTFFPIVVAVGGGDRANRTLIKGLNIKGNGF